MRIHNIPGDPGRTQKKKRVGRGEGSGHGKTSGRGNKGAKSRSGARRRSHFEGGQMPLIRRLPKRGFRSPFPKVYTPVNLTLLEKHFDADAVVDPVALLKKGIIHGSETGCVKILGQGDVTKKFHIKAHAFSKSALEKIQSQGGKCEVLPC
jgi:large subunit ribosomal protein L15